MPLRIARGPRHQCIMAMQPFPCTHACATPPGPTAAHDGPVSRCQPLAGYRQEYTETARPVHVALPASEMRARCVHSGETRQRTFHWISGGRPPGTWRPAQHGSSCGSCTRVRPAARAPRLHLPQVTCLPIRRLSLCSTRSGRGLKLHKSSYRTTERRAEAYSTIGLLVYDQPSPDSNVRHLVSVPRKQS